MKLFIDTSALIKNYIEEKGSVEISEIMYQADEIFISQVTPIECISTIRRILLEKRITEAMYQKLKDEIFFDAKYFQIVDNKNSFFHCESVIDRYQLKTLDSIQLSSALYVKGSIDSFVCCDNKLNKAAEHEGLQIVNPLSK